MIEAVKSPNINLRPKIQDLQSDILDLLQDISKLMRTAQRDLNDRNSQEKYAESQQQIEQEIQKVGNLELRMAIVAPMKAGKSTIINAIVGQDLLPSRNAAMTTIPTKISFNNHVEKPELSLSENTLAVFQNTWSSLQQKINHLAESELENLISQYPHLQDLAKKIKSDRCYIPAEVSGKEHISLVLIQLNDLVRLCCTLDPSLDPLNKLEDVPEVKTPFWRSNNTEQTKQLGNLVIVDTPGPNEAGDNLRLTAVVEQELKRCSIVLIVLDFTQLNNQAAEAVKRQVQPIIDVIGKDNLYVLVNKVDQRLSGDMTSQEVKKFIYSDLDLSESEDSDRIFEISARQAFSATKFLLELQQNSEIELANMSSIEALAKQVLGNRWERKLQKKTAADLEEEAEFLWEDSGFDEFIINSIQALIANAAPKCISTALKLSSHLLTVLKDDLSLRASAISEDASKLEAEINALTTDLKHLELCRSRLKTVDKIKHKLQINLQKILEQLIEEAKISVESHFKEEDDNRANIFERVDRSARNFFFQDIGGDDILPRTVIDKLKYKTKNVLEFHNKYEADQFANETINWSKQRANSLLSQARLYTEKEISESQIELLTSLKKETKDILEKARDRLNKAFDIKLALPPNPELNSELGRIDFKVNNLSREVTDYKTERSRPWYFLWLWEIEQQVPITRTESYYTVSLQDIVKQINTAIEANVNKINSQVNQYLDLDFKNAVDDYFTELDAYLSNYRNSIKQAQADGQLDIKKKEQLVVTLQYLIPEVNNKLKKTTEYQTKVQQLV
ncbi:dynamin family protein [Pleurocapsa sp. PCC 7319]|uniref:dynamin family protein n=1 Tax=Pleurocapsa sp. PCC 7319 TaxID=118161 RepID=UPI00034DFD82|nr:dynamin family protein [Pleurocapsa sp. PCC 7319]